MTLSYFTGMLECLSSSFLLIRATIGADELVFSILVGPCTCSYTYLIMICYDTRVVVATYAVT